MGIDGGRYFRTSFNVISGKVVRKPASITRQSVDSANVLMAAWIKSILFPMVVCRLQWVVVWKVFRMAPVVYAYLDLCGLVFVGQYRYIRHSGDAWECSAEDYDVVKGTEIFVFGKGRDIFCVA